MVKKKGKIIQEFLIPADKQVYDMAFSISWIDGDGVLNSVTKNVPRTLEETKKHIRFVKEITHGKPICLIADVSHSGYMDRETREYARKEFPKVYKAMAFVTSSPLGKMISNILSGLTHPAMPVKTFTSEAAARKWIKQFL
jgi:hypothetical protein